MFILLSVGLVAALFSLGASYVIWRSRGRSALSNMLAAAAAVTVGALIVAVLIAVLTQMAFKGI